MVRFKAVPKRGRDVSLGGAFLLTPPYNEKILESYSLDMHLQ